MGILLASAARTASGSFEVPNPTFVRAEAGLFLLDVTAAATDVGDTLDVFLQGYVGLSGSTDLWQDFIHFTQVLGNGGAKRFLATWMRGVAPASLLAATVEDGALAAGVRQGPIGERVRVKWVIVDAGTVNASFTFSVQAAPYRVR